VLGFADWEQAGESLTEGEAMNRGAEFGEITPRGNAGTIDLFSRNGVPSVLNTNSYGSGDAINDAEIQQVTPTNSFRIGQQVFFWLGISPALAREPRPVPYISRIRLKLWWLRPNVGFRAVGYPSWQPIDRTTFGDGPNSGIDNNRWVWIPSPKRLDITQYQTAPPAASPALDSDSLLLDECWTMDLPDPTTPAQQANYPSPQFPVRWVSILMPAMGYALGWTWDADFVDTESPLPIPYSLSWQTGTLGGTVYQESIG